VKVGGTHERLRSKKLVTQPGFIIWPAGMLEIRCAP